MFALDPEREEIVAYCMDHLSEFGEVADSLRIPKFSFDCINELAEMLGGQAAAQLVESVTRLGNYGDSEDHARQRAAVSNQLKAKGVSLPRGKRTRSGMSELVGDIAPILIYYGLAPATNERSRLVNALRIIAEEIPLDGDPRDELRRAKREDAIRLEQQRAAIREAVAKGLQSLKIITPP